MGMASHESATRPAPLVCVLDDNNSLPRMPHNKVLKKMQMPREGVFQ